MRVVSCTYVVPLEQHRAACFANDRYHAIEPLRVLLLITGILVEFFPRDFVPPPFDTF